MTEPTPIGLACQHANRKAAAQCASSPSRRPSPSSALRKGIALEVTVGAATLVKATGKVRGRTVAKGSKRAAGAGTVTVRLKATKKAAKRLRKLRGKTLRIKVAAGGASASMTRKLR